MRAGTSARCGPPRASSATSRAPTTGASSSTSTRDWRPLPEYNADQPRHPFRPFGITPGHGLEWSRLLLQIHAALGGRPDWLVEAARGLFARAVDDGWEEPGGFAYTTDLDGRPVVADRLHWPVTEAIGAAAALHETTGDEPTSAGTAPAGTSPART